MSSPGGKISKHVRVTAVVAYRPDKTPVTTYEVQEVDSDSGSIVSDNSPLRTPSPEGTRSSETAWWTSPPGAPRIPFLPTPRIACMPLAANNSRRDIGLGLNLGCEWGQPMSTISYQEEAIHEGHTFESYVFHPHFHTIEPRYTGAGLGWGITIDNTDSSTVDDDTLVESEDDSAAYYHLPSNLLSPELVMSTEEFKESLKKWMERRERAVSDAHIIGRDAHIKHDAPLEKDSSSEQEQDSRRKSV